MGAIGGHRLLCDIGYRLPNRAHRRRGEVREPLTRPARRSWGVRSDVEDYRPEQSPVLRVDPCRLTLSPHSRVPTKARSAGGNGRCEPRTARAGRATEGIVFVPFFPLHGSGGRPLAEIAERHNATPTQIALAWLLRRSPTMLPIPGTLSLKHLRQNLSALEIELSDDEFETLVQAQA